MAADHTDMGTELAGSGTVSAPTATWFYMSDYTSESNWDNCRLYVSSPEQVNSPLKLNVNYSSNTFDTHCC